MSIVYLLSLLTLCRLVLCCHSTSLIVYPSCPSLNQHAAYHFSSSPPCCLSLLHVRISPSYGSCQMRTILYGKKAANLYTQAFVQNTQARALYQESEDTYYRANDAASYDDWRRARHQWDYFYNRH
ncbi:hypothetical protein GUITHDRAFT_153138 [Guillardia theta CCMP2712]|uniref:Uncharacterized protein n=2 Tax=Guillardia theta (strain CCMP2712) TaxID=905079 RepID=L1J7E9_GUITC|nr:hypothetical protein GUITHDRAFT_153138 [Guillardia theta CCMP2712]EKX44029.1 hypothetical protein GUITHDRAFT_153138 [Guillardia theta CCMP2712]|eukprot:XP_005831009.1 hypothetical protein GUITHDRAFT_153138 [Guillardia theta CCMP2712]